MAALRQLGSGWILARRGGPCSRAGTSLPLPLALPPWILLLHGRGWGGKAAWKMHDSSVLLFCRAVFIAFAAWLRCTLAFWLGARVIDAGRHVPAIDCCMWPRTCARCGADTASLKDGALPTCPSGQSLRREDGRWLIPSLPSGPAAAGGGGDARHHRIETGRRAAGHLTSIATGRKVRGCSGVHAEVIMSVGPQATPDAAGGPAGCDSDPRGAKVIPDLGGETKRIELAARKRSSLDKASRSLVARRGYERGNGAVSASRKTGGRASALGAVAPNRTRARGRFAGGASPAAVQCREFGFPATRRREVGTGWWSN